MDLQLLNAERHGGLHQADVSVERAHFVQIVAAEFTMAAAICPIFLTKNPETGQFYAGAMFGFEPGENLLGPKGGERRTFLPLDLERQGYYLAPGGIAIDPDHPRFTSGRGAALFERDGEPGQALRRIQHVLGQLSVGVPETDALIQSLVALGLIESIDVDLSFDDGRSLSLAGLYTVSLDALGELGDAAVLDLFRRGHLQLIYAMAGSLKQVSVLANLKNERLAA
jgi:hypothetical protein